MFFFYVIWLVFISIAILGIKRKEGIKKIRARGGLFLLVVSLLLMISLALFPHLWTEILGKGFRS